MTKKQVLVIEVEAQFFKAVREGISPKGYYYPAFPFIYYNKITDQDLRDIKAYLDAIPAVRKAHYQNHMMFPFNWRFLQLGWRILFFNFKKTGPYHLDTTKTPNVESRCVLSRRLDPL